MGKIRNIVFDVGRVLIQVDHSPLWAFLDHHGATISSETEFIQQTNMTDFEAGKLTDDEFLNGMAGLFPHPPSQAQLHAAWVNIFSPIEAMLDLALQLKATHRVYLLSNTNNLHWEHIVPVYQLADLCHAILTSHTCGLLKPDPAIYRLAEQEFGLQPAETVFIDDLSENAQAAHGCGWSAINHISFEDTSARLSDFGVL